MLASEERSTVARLLRLTADSDIWEVSLLSRSVEPAVRRAQIAAVLQLLRGFDHAPASIYGHVYSSYCSVVDRRDSRLLCRNDEMIDIDSPAAYIVV